MEEKSVSEKIFGRNCIDLRSTANKREYIIKNLTKGTEFELILHTKMKDGTLYRTMSNELIISEIIRWADAYAIEKTDI